MVKPAAFRRAVGFLQAEFRTSTRRACRVLGFARSSLAYESHRENPPGLLERLKALAAKRTSWGYRQLNRNLRREGFNFNHKRIYRLYRLEGLTVRRKHRKKMASRARVVLPKPTRPNERWSMDFVSDALWGGRRFRIFVVIDDFTREALALVADTSLGGARVARILDELVATRGAPELIVSDNGPEFTGKALDEWAYRTGVKLHHIRPGKPVENAYVESFNGKLRNECLNQHWFTDLADARVTIEEWRRDYNEERPHSSLDGKTPFEFASQFNPGLSLKVA